MRFVGSIACLLVVTGCAATQLDAESPRSTYDSRTTTGSNIPRKGSAVVVDKSVVQDQPGRQGAGSSK